MNDLNFFEDHVDKKDLKSNRMGIYIFIYSVFFLGLVGYIGYNAMIIKNEKEIVKNLKAVAENPDVLKTVEAIREKEIQVDGLRGAIDKINLLNTTVADRRKVDDLLLKQINDAMPNDIFITSIGIQNDGIYIDGISKDRWAIPEFQKNLEYLEDVDEIFVPYITLEEDHYNFTLDITLRGDEDEGQGEEELEGEAEETETDEGTDQE